MYIEKWTMFVHILPLTPFSYRGTLFLLNYKWIVTDSIRHYRVKNTLSYF
jgi:hypothetical protein